MGKEFDPGEIVEHKLSREWVMVLEYNSKEDFYLCRTKSFEEKKFKSFELQERKTNTRR